MECIRHLIIEAPRVLVRSRQAIIEALTGQRLLGEELVRVHDAIRLTDDANVRASTEESRRRAREVVFRL
jgi:hypothetical protein